MRKLFLVLALILLAPNITHASTYSRSPGTNPAPMPISITPDNSFFAGSCLGSSVWTLIFWDGIHHLYSGDMQTAGDGSHIFTITSSTIYDNDAGNAQVDPTGQTILQTAYWCGTWNGSDPASFSPNNGSGDFSGGDTYTISAGGGGGPPPIPGPSFDFLGLASSSIDYLQSQNELLLLILGIVVGLVMALIFITAFLDNIKKVARGK